MRIKAIALAAIITIAPAVFAQPRGADPGFDWSAPFSRIMKIVKHFVHAALEDPQTPPPNPHP